VSSSVRKFWSWVGLCESWNKVLVKAVAVVSDPRGKGVVRFYIFFTCELDV
jgi:hypothetical protein